ncbi:MAG: LamG-like jellyroll fold domain-containing protein, partial [Bacteroidota bacterium]
MVSEEDNTITLDWTDNAFDETEYEIQRRFGDASNTFSVAADDTMYVDEALLACRGYEYDVYAKNVCGLSNESAQTSARLEPNLSAVLSSNAVEASKGRFMNRVELTWTPQNNAGNIIDRYRVYRKVLGNTDSVQIDVVSGNANIYRDETADAGILYEYTLVGETDCDGDVLQSNVISTVGYRTATALVSGQVTYTGGNAVEGVKVLVAPADGTQVGKSLVLDGTDDKVTFDSLDLNSSFTIEFWSKRANNNANILFSHGDTTSTASQNLQLGYDAGGSFYMEFGAEVLSSNTSYNDTDWHHWTCVYDAASNERLIYHNDSLLIKDNPSGAYTTQGIYQLGSAVSGAAFFNGQFDEMRIWKTARDSAEIVRDYNRILNNDDANLLAMYSFDEGIGVEVYDRSKIGITYNSRHGKMMGVNSLNEAWSMVIPTPDQLGLYGITDANGNYIVAAIPYSGTGSAFKVVPQFGTHQFEPSQTNLFIGQGSDIFNGTNFNDISSFPVTGTVFYQGTSCPADQIEIQIDGVTAILNGNKVMTTSDGAFTVDVPIGRHRVSLYKEGHEFAVGQFPTNGSLFDFQEPISGLEFIDSTRLKVIGRVVGGTREGDKVPGLGRSVNNIGKARVVYEALVGNGCHQDTVFTDSQTGEYVTYLYPLKYVVKDVRVSNPMQNISTSDFFDALPQINLVNIGDETTARDSVFTAGTTNLERVDSIKYNYRQDFIYRNTAEIAVLMEDQSSKFGGQEAYSTEYNGGTFEVNTLKSDSGVYPVFERGKEYRAYISATENYENFDNDAPIVEDKVP